MHRLTDMFAPIVGRILVGGYFLWSAVGVALNYPDLTAQSGVLMFIEALAGIALIVGFKIRAASLTLIIFTLIVSFITSQFELHSLAIIGGLLYISAYGSDVWPIRKR